MKISSEIKKYIHNFDCGKIMKGGFVVTKLLFPFSKSNVYFRHITEFVFVNCVTVSNVFNTNVPVKAFFPH